LNLSKQKSTFQQFAHSTVTIARVNKHLQAAIFSDIIVFQKKREEYLFASRSFFIKLW